MLTCGCEDDCDSRGRRRGRRRATTQGAGPRPQRGAERAGSRGPPPTPGDSALSTANAAARRDDRRERRGRRDRAARESGRALTLVDANILLFAVDEESPFHEPAVAW